MNEVSIESYCLTIMLSNSTPSLYWVMYKKMSEYKFPKVFKPAQF